MQHPNWSCSKCENTAFETDRFAATGTGFARIFDVQNKKFTTVTCTRCRYTEMYKADSNKLGDIFDFLTD